MNGATYGTGGSATSRVICAGGGSGGYKTAIVAVTPNGKYTIVVGGGGAGGKFGNGVTANNSAGGCVFIEWGQGV